MDRRLTPGGGPLLLVATTDELGTERFARIDAVVEAAFGKPFGAIWTSIGPGTHVLAEHDGRAIGHAMVVERELHIGARRLRVGYVENVATAPRLQRRGIGASVMGRIGELIADRFDIGALATGTHRFYEGLGWKTWRGPTHVRIGDRIERTPNGDGHVMVLRVPRTPTIRVDEPISIGWREGAIW